MVLNKYARNCPDTSAMRLMAPTKLKFDAPDPPKFDFVEKEPVVEDVKPTKGKKKEEEAPVEEEKSPEEMAEEKMFSDFVATYRKAVKDNQEEVGEYR